MERIKEIAGVLLVVFGCAIAIVAVLGVFMALWSIAANAESYRCSYVRQTYPAWDSWQGIVVTRERWVRRCYRNHTYYLPEDAPTRVYGYTRRDDDRDCKPMIRVVGQQALTVDGAKKEANEAFAAMARFHHGEKYLDLANARRLTYTCSRSSIKEAGISVTTLGQSFTRCELTAVPCSPPRDREER